MQTTYSTGDRPVGLAIGDFNNDTRLDIVVSNSGNNTIGVLLGYGNGSFASQKTYSTGAYPFTLAVNDFNNDTRPDIVVTNYHDDSVSILLRYDRGALKNGITFTPSTGAHLRSVAVSDFNNDSLLDIVVANYGSNNLGVILGYGNGTFGNEMIFSTGLKSHPYSITINDFNKDGQVDIAVVNRGTKSLSTFLGKGNGTFESQANYSTSFDFVPLAVGVGDFNSDGHSEIVVAYDDTDNLDVFVIYDTGDFSPRTTYSTDHWPTSIAFGDFNNDTRL
ncbi:unnamed protein product, partial [Rotaria sordida]